MINKKVHLSRATKLLWGKLSRNGSHEWLPLWIHLDDTAETAKLLWDHWLPESTKKIIAEGINSNFEGNDEKMTYAKKIAVFMAASHDIGKASPVFQQKATRAGYAELVDVITSEGLSISFSEANKKGLTHPIVSQKVLEQAGINRSYSVIVGGHHGKPPNNDEDVDRAVDYPSVTGIGKKGWKEIHSELVNNALSESGLSKIPEGNILIQAQVILTGFLIMADWIASGDGFDLIPYDYFSNFHLSSKIRAEKVWKKLNIPEYGRFSDVCPVQSLYKKRFSITYPRPMQIDSVQAATSVRNPGIFVIEAPMGEGKTEAALAVAEVLANKYKMSGIYFALPTQATSDGIFNRIEEWIEKLHGKKVNSILLSHGKAGFNEDYQGIKIRFKNDKYNGEDKLKEAEKENVVVNDWTQGRKKGLLSDFVVGTVDQILMCGLKQKHLALRHLGIANKIVIIDECHAYDAYMSSYLDLVLKWLGLYHVPTVVLSATLPPYRRKKIIESYSEKVQNDEIRSPRKLSLKDLIGDDVQSENEKDDGKNSIKEDTLAYPLISYSDYNIIKEIKSQKSGRSLNVKIEQLDEEKLMQKIKTLLTNGGCVGIIRNTVKKAQETAKILEDYFGDNYVKILHSRFISCDRVRKEMEVRALLGPKGNRPNKLIVVGTQVMEQSLDVDFDVLFTDICPMDLLLQRIGRLHRHLRTSRPDKVSIPICFILGINGDVDFDDGAAAVYGTFLLLKTKAFLENRTYISIPDDIPKLVQQTYEKNYNKESVRLLCNGNNEESVQKIFKKAQEEYEYKLKTKKEKAKTFQINTPQVQQKQKTLIGWLRADYKDISGKKGEATVRDIDSSLDVLVVMKKDDGYIYTLPWLTKNGNIKIQGVPDDNLAKSIAGCSVSLPAYFKVAWQIDKIIEELENTIIDNNLEIWYDSYWLNGELFLILDKNYKAKLGNKNLHYNKKYGLIIEDMEE